MQRIIASIGWLFADRVLNLAFGVFLGIWIARYLGPEQYGLFNYILAFVTLFGPLSALGLDGIVVRDIVNDPSCVEETLGTAFVLKLAGGLLTLLLTVSGMMLLRPTDELSHWFVAIISFGTIFKSLDVIDLWFQSQVQVKYAVIARNVALLFVTIAKIYLIEIEAPLSAFVWATFVEVALIATGFLGAYIFTGGQVRRWRFSVLRAQQLMRDCWPLAIAGVAVIIYMKIDLVMLGELLDNRAVGIYAVAARLSEIWYFVPIAIMTAVAPSIIESKKVGEILYYQKIRSIFKVMTFLSLMIAIPMTFLSQNLILMLFGAEYAQAGIILALHIWSSIFVFLGVAQGTWDIVEGLTKNALQRTILGAIINIVLNLCLIPLYASLGSAVATVIAYAFSASILNLCSSKTRNIFWLQMKSILFFR